jgi:hypothetical protein
VGVVAGRDEQGGGGLGAGTVERDERGCGGGSELVEEFVEFGDLVAEVVPAARQVTQRALRGVMRVSRVLRWNRAAAAATSRTGRPWNRARSSSGAVSMIEWIWFAVWVRALRALRRATWSRRIDSSEPSAVFAAPCSSPPDCTARAAEIASVGSDLP